jgi:hypothetical protein
MLFDWNSGMKKNAEINSYSLSLRERVGVRACSITRCVRFQRPLTLTLSRRERGPDEDEL